MRTSLQPALLLLALLVVINAGCGKESTRPDPRRNLPQTSPANVLELLEYAYEVQDPDVYARLLADDFRFHFEVVTRHARQLPEFWDRPADSTGTRHLLRASVVRRVRVRLFHGGDVAVNELGRENWRLITVTDTFVEVQVRAEGQPDTIFVQVVGDLQQFYFRQGRNPAEAEAARSDPGILWYLVDWRDMGRIHAPSLASEPSPVEEMTWSGLKTMPL